MFHVKVLYSSTSETASFGKPGSCGGHPVTTQDASCINLSIANEQFKRKLTAVPIKNPYDYKMLKVIIQVLKGNTTELNVCPSLQWNVRELINNTVEEYSEPLQN